MADVTSQDMAGKLLAAGFERVGPSATALSDPIADTPMVVTLDQLRPYDHDPRKKRNPAYEEIKASIRERGLDTAPAMTRRPGEDHYIIRNGGNTRLAILRELWSETKDERFFRISCLFRPWPERGEIVALTGHLAENELRGGLTFIERALGVEKAREFYELESGIPLSQSELARRLAADGYPVQQSHISRMADAVRYPDDPSITRFATGDRKFNPHSAAFGALVNLTPQWQLTSNLAYTERAPKDYELFANGPHVATAAWEVGDPSLQKEKSAGFDIGAQWKDRANTARVNAYVTRFRNYIGLTASGNQLDDEGVPVTDRDANQSLAEYLYGGVRARFTGLEANGNLRLQGPDGFSRTSDGSTLDLAWRTDVVRATSLLIRHGLLQSPDAVQLEPVEGLRHLSPSKVYE